MPEAHLVRHGAPTLAGIKTGSAFLCPFRCPADLFYSVRRLNRKLNPKGLRLLPLRLHRDRALLYLYRPARLSADLAEPDAVRLLARCGYQTGSSDRCLIQLIHRLHRPSPFPHELGLFLGYPPEDVQGFMENRTDCKYTGCWKVYGDAAAARAVFERYRSCTRSCCRRWAEGAALTQLAAADPLAAAKKHPSALAKNPPDVLY